MSANQHDHTVTNGEEALMLSTFMPSKRHSQPILATFGVSNDQDLHMDKSDDVAVTR